LRLCRSTFLLATTFAGIRLVTISGIRIRGDTGMAVIRIRGMARVVMLAAVVVATVGLVEMVVMRVAVGTAMTVEDGPVGMVVMLEEDVDRTMVEAGLVDLEAVVVLAVVWIRRHRGWLITKRGVA
jgi:hypothetical protein